MQSTHESKLPYYGAVGGQLVDAAQRLYQVDAVLEKPTPTEAEQKLDVPGPARRLLPLLLRHARAHAGRAAHARRTALTRRRARETTVNFRAALARLAEQERYLACELDGRRYDFGVKYGLLTAQLALALSGKDRDEVLRGLVELLANKVAR